MTVKKIYSVYMEPPVKEHGIYSIRAESGKDLLSQVEFLEKRGNTCLRDMAHIHYEDGGSLVPAKYVTEEDGKIIVNRDKE